mmetsp:Transcript_132997/g.248717  ORF Transcript_132997/g.248717 Transcript_132997/m.248717 type:complete len:1710 (-) Transcript_132997:151-5280(-)
MATHYAQGTLIWIKHDEEVWVQAEIVTSNDKEIIVKTTEDPDGRIVFGPSEPFFLRTIDTYTSEGLSVLDDLTQLTHLHEPAVLSSLQHRFDIDKIYTFTGPILIALNPFKTIRGLYDEKVLNSFISAKPVAVPHVFNTSNAAFRGICDRQKCQTVLISGESGAGKTETTKFVMKFLAVAGSADGEMTNVEKQVLESNPLLEAFGNARTLRNDNSSRFGKFIILQFQPENAIAPVQTGMAGGHSRLCGAKIQTYLLEKVRVCDQQEGERNYHIFYEACAAVAKAGTTSYQFPQVLDKSKVKNEVTVNMEGFAELGKYAYLTRSTCTTLKDVDDVLMFERRIAAMQTIGIKHEDVESMLAVIASVLHLGNVKFDAPANNSEGSMAMAECEASMEISSKLLGISRQDLEACLTNVTRVTRTEKIRSPVNIRQAADNRDSLAKALYSLVFNFIVGSTNLSIGYLNHVKLFAGVLDIFGFECFKMNSFEQLCINFTNERLQQFFNQFVFKLEEQLYEREGIPWDALDFPDNQDAVDILMAKTSGVLAILDEECMVPQGSDQGFCNKLMRTHKGHRRFDEIKTKPTWFVIKHFAGPVQYCTDAFLDKNKDQLSNDLIECMASSSNAFVGGLIKGCVKFADFFADKAPTEGTHKKKKKYSVSSEFKDQLSNLMDIVDTTEPHFIRCIKPNPQNEPDKYDRKSVTEQLRYGGVLQVVQVSRAGYPVRINHQECWDDYKVIAAPTVVSGLKHVDDAKVRAQKLLEHLETELNIPVAKHGVSWAVGKTLCFFKQSAFERLKFARLELLIKSVTIIQAQWRGKVRRNMYKVIRLMTRHVEALIRGKQARLELLNRRREKAVVTIQAAVRKSKARKEFGKIIRKVVKLQAWRRGFTGRKKAKEFKLFSAARKIQRNWKRRQEQKTFQALLKSIHIAQQRFRMHTAKSTLKKLKQEAKEVGALVAKSQKAQEQIAELRKKNEELEGQHYQLEAEKNTLHTKAKTLEDALSGLQDEKVELEKGVQAAADAAAEQAKNEQLQEKLRELEGHKSSKDEQIQALQESVEALSKELKAKKEKCEAVEKNYQNLLRSETVRATTGSKAAPESERSLPATKKLASSRNVDIQLVGASGVGKTKLLEMLIEEHDSDQMEVFRKQKAQGNLMSHYQIQIGEGVLKVLDCSGVVKAKNLVKDWFVRSCWVFVVYDVTRPDTLTTALELVEQVKEAKSKVVIFGNKWGAENGGSVEADVRKARDIAAQAEGLCFESTKLMDAVQPVMDAIADGTADGAAPEPSPEPSDAAAPGGNDLLSDMGKRGSLGAAIQSVKSFFGGGTQGQNARGGVLRPSLKGTKAMKYARKEASGGVEQVDLRPVQELQDSESAVTCICFGQERLHKAYLLLATASKDGTVVIYRCYRTEMEIQLLSDQDFPQDEDTSSIYNQPPADHSNIAVHSRLVGHSRAITSIFFNLLEDQLVTTSIDKSVRFWGVDTAEMLKVFTDSSPVPVARFLPFNPQVFVAANSNAVLRLVNVQNGMVLQKLKVETEVRALMFDDSGLFLLAGTKNGSIHVLEASDSNSLKFKFKVQLARGGVTCITFVGAAYGQPACLLVNTSDSSATIIDCIYAPGGSLTNLSVRHRVRVAHSLLPLKCCYSPSGQGYLISGSEDKEVYIYSLAKGSNYKMMYLKYHQVPVVAVAVNMQDTLLASADSLGRIVLWRRMDFSHIPD